jgi:hypothetical protein
MIICFVVVGAGDRALGRGERARRRVEVERILRDCANVADHVAV